MAASYDTSFLTTTIGEPLAKAVAATVAAKPSDAVQFLGEYLLKHVSAERARAEHERHAQEAAEEEALRAEHAAAEARAQAASAAARAASLQGLASMRCEPAAAAAAAVQMIKTYTSAGAAYVAVVAEPQPKDWQQPPPLASEGDTHDEASDEEGGDDGADNAEDGAGAGAAGDESAAGTAGDGTTTTSTSSGPPPDTSRKLLRYIAASKGQEFMMHTELQRSSNQAAVAGMQGKLGDSSSSISSSGGGDTHPPEAQQPVSFRVLDERLPVLVVPAVGAEPRVRYLRDGLAHVGCYVAAAVPACRAAGGGCHALLCADTLLPDGSGLPLPEHDIAFLWDAARALGTALDGAAASVAASAARGAGAAVLRGLACEIAALRGVTPALAEVPEVGEAPVPPMPQLEEGNEQANAEHIAHLEAQLAHAGERAAAARPAASNAAAVLAQEQQVLAAIVKAIMAVRGTAIQVLRLHATGPPATASVLRAVLLLLGRDPASILGWGQVVPLLGSNLFDEIAAVDATVPRDLQCWSRVRAAYKAVPHSGQALLQELPQCGMGALLLQWVRQVKRLEVAAARAQETAAAAKDANTAMTECETVLAAARQAQGTTAHQAVVQEVAAEAGAVGSDTADAEEDAQ